MSAPVIVAAFVQVVGGLLIAPLLPGLVQYAKGVLQGRRGPSPLQPYRELARLWAKAPVSPEGTTFIYRVAPAVVAAAVATACLLLPIGGRSPEWPVGHDALVLIGLLALARFALAASAWDTGGGFGLMGVESRPHHRRVGGGPVPPRHRRGEPALWKHRPAVAQ